MRYWSKYLWIGTSVAFLLACIFPIILAIIPMVVEWTRKSDFSLYTTPLDPKVVQDICGKFLSVDDPRCEPGEVVYAPEFFPEIRRYFQDGSTIDLFTVYLSYNSY